MLYISCFWGNTAQWTKQYQTKYQGGHGNLSELIFLPINKKHHLFIVDYHSKFPMKKWVEGLSTYNLIQICEIFSEYGLLSKTLSDTDTNFMSEKFKNFCKQLSMYHAISSSYNYQSNVQAEVCKQFGKEPSKIVLTLMLTYFVTLL